MTSKSKYNSFSVSGVNALPRFGNGIQTETKENLSPYSKAVALYIHIPYCRSICQFCMLRRGAKTVKSIPDHFIDVLVSEFYLYRSQLEECNISAIYFGGGTPSMLNCKQLDRLMLSLRKTFIIRDDVEITFEGEPVSLNNEDLLNSLLANNIQRISFGLQTFNKSLRALLGRTDKISDVFNTRELIDRKGFRELNVDYLYYLPSTGVSFLENELKQMCELSPNSIDCHPLKYISCSTNMLEEMRNKKLVVPSHNERILLFNHIREWCKQNGYIEHFVDQYSRLDKKNSNLYMQHLYGMNGGEYIGFGPGARSHFKDIGFQNNQNVDIYLNNIRAGKKPYIRNVWAAMSDNYITCFPKRNDTLLTGDIQKSSAPDYFFEQLNNLTNRGYLQKKNGGYIMSKNGLNWYQNLQEELLSIEQRANHISTAKKRMSKFQRFGEYFNNIGELYDRQ